MQERPVVNVTASGVEERAPYSMEDNGEMGRFMRGVSKGKRQFSHIKHQARLDDSEHYPSSLNLGSFSPLKKTPLVQSASQGIER